jgi:hypothetical protein
MARLERQGLSSKKRRTAKVNGPRFGFDGFGFHGFVFDSNAHLDRRRLDNPLTHIQHPTSTGASQFCVTTGCGGVFAAN